MLSNIDHNFEIQATSDLDLQSYGATM